MLGPVNTRLGSVVQERRVGRESLGETSESSPAIYCRDFAQAEPRPVGTDEMELGRRRLKKMIERPAGTRSALFPKPGNKLPGYSQPSRRDG